MAYIVRRRTGGWEIRESHMTPRGPRSNTLASFQTLTPEVICKAQARSARALDREELRTAAARAGAPIAPEPSDRATSELLAELAAGRRPRPVLGRLLLDLLQDRRDSSSDSALAATMWIGATPQQRGDALRDLLLLADRLPVRMRQRRLQFPRIQPARP